MMTRARIVAVVGIDGAGKSTVVETLHEQYVSSDRVRCVWKRNRDCVERLARAAPQHAGSWREYRQGPFAEAIRWAHALDFLRFYEEEVIPLLNDDVCIVSDRWSCCSLAYAAALPGVMESLDGALSVVATPDCVIYLHLDPEQAVARITKARDLLPDEHVQVLDDFKTGYEHVLSRLHAPIVRIPPATPSEIAMQVDAIVRRLAGA